MSFSLRVGYFAICIATLGGCVSLNLGSKSAGPPPAVTLKLKPFSETTAYYSHADIKIFEEDQLIRSRDEVVTFSVKSDAALLDPKSGRFELLTKTIARDGSGNLRELGFPELGEEIRFELTPQGEVLKAGDYPKDSLFFVPSVPIPSRTVSVGETWRLLHSWVGAENNLPLTVDLVAILKALYTCGNRKCADIEVSGEVKSEVLNHSSSKFKSEISGRLVFDLDLGVLVWSLVRNTQDFVSQKNRVFVRSCLISVLSDPKEFRWSNGNDIFCNAKSKGSIEFPVPKSSRLIYRDS